MALKGFVVLNAEIIAQKHCPVLRGYGARRSRQGVQNVPPLLHS